MTDQNYQPQNAPQPGQQPYQQQPVQQPYQQPAQQPYQQQPVQQPYQQPAQQPYQQQPVQQPAQYANPQYNGAPQPYAQGAQIEDKSGLYIGLSIAELILCGGLFAIIPLVLSIQYKNACQSGSADQAAAKRKSARTALIVVLIVGILATVAYVGMTVNG